MKHVCTRFIGVVALSSGFLASAWLAHGQEVLPSSSSLALGIKVGTLGLSAEATIPLAARLNIRGVGNYLDFSTDETIDDIDYELEMAFSSYGGYFDLHPFANNFRISAGALFNDNEITLDATPTGAIDIGGATYPGRLVGTLSGDLTFEEVAPYLGIGFGNAATSPGGWSFSFDLGVVLQTSELELTADGPLNRFPEFRDDLEAEEEDIQDEIDKYEIYPVLSFGMAYRF